LAAKLNKYLIDLTYEAALKSFWRHAALKKFLLSVGVTNNIEQTSDVTKRELLDCVFFNLQKTDKGKGIIFQMALALSEYLTFPDLRGFEGSESKTKDAQQAVQELKSYLDKQNDEIASERKRQATKDERRLEKANIQRAQTDKTNLQERLDAMFSKVGTQQGGYEFEEWFYELLSFCEEIKYKKPYKTDGRQIDGSLTYEGTTYLVELKFTKEQSGVDVVDSLKAKVDKMADNTMGIIVSINGYSKVAISDASGRKTTLMLMDARHLYYFFTGAMKFGDIIARIRCHASQTGKAYLDVNDFNN
jgi:hypothetical protein